MQARVFPIVATMSAAAVLLSSCGSDDSADTSSTTAAEASSPAATETTTAEPTQASDNPSDNSAGPTESGSAESGSTESDPTETASETTEGESSSGANPRLEEFTTGEQVYEADVDAPASAELVEIRVGEHDGYERIVFEYADHATAENAPGFWSDYIDGPALEIGRGEPIGFDSDTVLQVNAMNQRLPDESIPENPSGIADSSLQELADSELVEQIWAGGWFEGQSTILLSLDEERPYLVHRAEDPSRLVIDIAQ